MTCADSVFESCFFGEGFGWVIEAFSRMRLYLLAGIFGRMPLRTHIILCFASIGHAD
jgi:hypothetical protein